MLEMDFRYFEFSLSPQLSGDYYDYRVDIAHLSIQPGEHLSKFYQRTIQLSTEITLANIPNGGMAELVLRFLTLLHIRPVAGQTLNHFNQLIQIFL